MKSFGLRFNVKRVFSYYVLLIFGISLMAFGIASYYEDQRTFEASISDEEIINRAKELGLVEVTEKIKDVENDDKN